MIASHSVETKNKICPNHIFASERLERLVTFRRCEKRQIIERVN